MEPTTQTVPAEAIEAYNQYIHGHIDRRAFMTRVNAIAATSVAATAMIEALTPNYAAAQQVSPTDPRIKTERVTRLLGPSTPSTLSPLACWNARNCFSVSAPHCPSTSVA